MNARSRPWLSLAVLLLVLAALVGWAYGRMTKARQAALSDASRAASAEALAHRILGVRRQLQLAAARGGPAADSPRPKIAAAAGEAAVTANVIRLVEQPPQRLGDLPYAEHTLELALRNVALEQVTSLAYILSQPKNGLLVQTLHLTDPKLQGAQTVWDADLVLSYLVYEPAPSGAELEP